MAKITILFKNRENLTIEAEKLTVRRSDYDNDLVGLSWEGLKDKRPMYVRLDEVMCIYQELDAEGTDL